MPVNTVKKSVERMTPRWNLVSRAIDGVLLDNRWVQEYLPIPNPEDDSPENKTRYEQYVMRTVYYNFIRRSLEGFRGTIMDKEPDQKLAPKIEYIEDDIDGNGLSLEQYVRGVVGQVLSLGRDGALVDMPRAKKGMTLKEAKENAIQAYVVQYDAKDIINDQDHRFGAINRTDLIVLREYYNDSDDEFQVDEKEQFRVLRLGIPPISTMEGIETPVVTNPIYYMEVWREDQVHDVFYPQKSDKSYFDEIPFLFFGSENNNSDIDFIPLEDAAVINVAHMRNSADYEESTFLLGQPQIYATGLSQHWITEVWGGKMYFGSRSVLTGPTGSSFGILQAQANTMAMEGMNHKEDSLVKLGARIVEPNTTQKTATQSEIDSASDNSILSSVAQNVSDGVECIQRWLSDFMGETGESTYQLSRKYGAQDASPELIKAWLQSLTERAMSLQTFIENMKSGGQLPQDVSSEDEMKRIEKDQLGRQEDQIDGLDQSTKETGTDNPEEDTGPGDEDKETGTED